ncbi:MAG: hypothetical protein JKY19_02630 [Alcanivoracaceae bacterium]|nr:hypothetical protein [Alcanivoracaceae bacterium]
MKIYKFIIMLILLSLVTNNVSAKSKNAAQKARKNNLSAVTVFMDISIISRKNNAAKKLTKLHSEFANEGYELLSIEVYTENGDLQGFYVSYKQQKAIIQK